MTKTEQKKRQAKEIRKFRNDNNIHRCQCCGRPLRDTPHHFLCGRCWRFKKEKPFKWRNYLKKHKAKSELERRTP
jgi:hypothetical protein